MKEDRKILGNVTDAKILVAGMDKKKKRTSGLKGLVIEFETLTTINDNTIIYLDFNGEKKPFKVREVEIEGDLLIGSCTETGYFARYLSRDEKLDIRDLIGCEITLVEDEESLKDIATASCWC